LGIPQTGPDGIEPPHLRFRPEYIVPIFKGKTVFADAERKAWIILE
jgi:hypothetical protein